MFDFKMLISYFTLGKKEFLFEDAYSKRKVYSFTDCFGDKWMKNGRWGFFNVKIEPDDDIEVLKEAYDLLTNYVRVE